MKHAAVVIGVSASGWLAGCGGISEPNGRAQLSDWPTDPLSATPAAPPGAQEPPVEGPCARGTTPQGDEMWRRSFADEDVSRKSSLAVDGSGNVLVARAEGETRKLDADGKEIWARPFGSLVATTREGNGPPVVAGTFSGTLVVGNTRLDAVGGTDVFVAMLDENGDVLRAFALGAKGDEVAVGLAEDSAGSVVVSGSGLGTVKIDPVGRKSWSQPFFGALAVDSRDDVIVTGALVGSLRFGDRTLESQGGEDVFVAKLSPQGTMLFARQFGDSGASQRGEAIAIDPSDAILVGGVLDGTVDFGGGALTVHEEECPSESWCARAGFVVKFSPDGEHQFSRALTPVQSVGGIVADSRSNVFVSGAYPGNAPPYRTPLLAEFDRDGLAVGTGDRLDGKLDAGGAGHALAVDACDRILWAFGAASTPGSTARFSVSNINP